MASDEAGATASATGTDVVRHVSNEVLVPLDVHAQKAAMDVYQEGLRSILDGGDWQDAGRGERFVKKSGWRKIAAWFNLSIEIVRDNVDRGEDGTVQRAQAWVRAIAPNGRFADGDGYCDVSESRFARNKAKLENDLRGTATTRATNRAISNLVGMGAVSAEEVEATGQAGPTYGPAVEGEAVAQLQRALAYLLAPEATDIDVQDRVVALIERITAEADGYLPKVVFRALGLTAAQAKAIREADLPWAEDPPAPDAEEITPAEADVEHPDAPAPDPAPDPTPEEVAEARAAATTAEQIAAEVFGGNDDDPKED